MTSIIGDAVLIITLFTQLRLNDSVTAELEVALWVTAISTHLIGIITPLFRLNNPIPTELTGSIYQLTCVVTSSACIRATVRALREG